MIQELNFLIEAAESKELKQRWDKKRNSIKELQNNIAKLRYRLKEDIGSPNEKTQIVATIIRIIEKTGARIGNKLSKSQGRFGISNLLKEHISIEGDTIRLHFVGKSGVENDVTLKDEQVAEVLRILMKPKQKRQEVFVTSKGLSVKARQVNSYLSEFNVTTKDLRGYRCNKLMSGKLRRLEKPQSETEIKREFNRVLREVAGIIGHTPGVLRKDYLLPEIEEQFYSGKMIEKI